MSQIVWEAPPPTNRMKWFNLLSPVMARPNVWARVYEGDEHFDHYGYVYKLRKGVLATPPGRWEFAGRRIDGKRCIWARYLGPDEAKP